MAAELYKTTNGQKFHAGKISLVLVGLPARGKTFIARHLSKYLHWLGLQTRTFSVTHYRRKHVGVKLDNDFFDPDNSVAWEQRLKIAEMALSDMEEYLNQGGQIGIFDAANTIEDRRQDILKRLTANQIKVVFIEVICDKEDVIIAKIKQYKVNSPEYQGVDEEEAFHNFKERISLYEKSYQTISEDSPNSFIKIVNIGEKIIVNNIKGYLQSRILYYLMNLNQIYHRIYFLASSTRNAQHLPEFLKKESCNSLKIWISTEYNSVNCSRHLDFCTEMKPQLSRLSGGISDEISEEELKKRFPEEYEKHQQDPYCHRYPRGESYHDLAVRLENIILELEGAKTDVMIIADKTVIQCLYAFFADIHDEQQIPFLEFGDDEICKIVPEAYGMLESRFEIGETFLVKQEEVLKRYMERY